MFSYHIMSIYLEDINIYLLIIHTFFRYIWPWSKKVALSHDSYTCHKFARTSPFPTQRTAGVGNFIGSVVSLNSSIGLTGEGGICPEKCRPKDHKDWLYC